MNIEKKKPAFHFFTQGKDSKIVSSAFQRQNGSGYCVKIGDTWYNFYIAKAKSEKKEEGA